MALHLAASAPVAAGLAAEAAPAPGPAQAPPVGLEDAPAEVQAFHQHVATGAVRVSPRGMVPWYEEVENKRECWERGLGYLGDFLTLPSSLRNELPSGYALWPALKERKCAACVEIAREVYISMHREGGYVEVLVGSRLLGRGGGRPNSAPVRVEAHRLVHWLVNTNKSQGNDDASSLRHDEVVHHTCSNPGCLNPEHLARMTRSAHTKHHAPHDKRRRL